MHPRYGLLLALAFLLPLIHANKTAPGTLDDPWPAASFCPQDVPRLALSPAPQSPGDEHPAGLPVVFAQPLALNASLTPENSGVWTAGGTWRLCILAPADTDSLTLIFNPLRLPLRASLEIRSSGGGSQTLGAWDVRGGRTASAPLPGNTLLLTYVPPPSQQRAISAPFGIEAVLQGVRPPALQKQSEDSNSGYAAGTGGARGDPGTAVADVLAGRVAAQAGGSLACLPDAACFPRWDNATAATVLLVLLSPVGGRFCTGTLINGPDTSKQYILTANHCRKSDDGATIANLWGVALGGAGSDVCIDRGDSSVADYAKEQQTTSSSEKEPKTAPPTILQGLEVVWADEGSDVLILDLVSEIPGSVRPYFLGYDGTFFLRDQSESGWGMVSYAAGDAKKLTLTTDPLRPVAWKEDGPTHVGATWTAGVTQEGSSGAALVDGDTGLAVAVLTGGPEPQSCEGGRDILGTLYAAFENGLVEVLGGEKSSGRVAADDGPGIAVFPSRVLIRERSGPSAALSIKLSEPPAFGEKITVSAALSVAQGLQQGEANITLRAPTSFEFTSDSWNVSQTLSVDPGEDTIAAGPLPFTIAFDLSSDKNSGLRKRRVVQGLRSDDEAPSGMTLEQPMIFTAGSRGVQGRDAAQLTATGTPFTPEIGDALTQVEPLGAVMYYNLTTADSVEIGLAACQEGVGAPLRVTVFFPAEKKEGGESVAKYVSSKDCASDEAPYCAAFEGDSGCSGFDGLVLPGTDNSLPYTFTVSSSTGEAAGYGLVASQSSEPGVLFSAAGGGSGGGGSG